MFDKQFFGRRNVCYSYRQALMFKPRKDKFQIIRPRLRQQQPNTSVLQQAYNIIGTYTFREYCAELFLRSSGIIHCQLQKLKDSAFLQLLENMECIAEGLGVLQNCVSVYCWSCIARLYSWARIKDIWVRSHRMRSRFA